MLLGSMALLAAVTLLPERTEVLIAPRASGPVEFAAMEMTNALSQAFGRAIPIVRAPTAGKTALILGANAWSAAAGIDVAKLPDEGFRIKTVGADRVFIAGQDAPIGYFMNRFDYSGTMKVKRATSFGVYEFLERFAGVRYFFPGELGTVIPRHDRIDVPDTDLTDAPDYPIRSYYTGPGYVWYAPTGEGRGSQLNVLRLRMESETVPCCHGSIHFRYAKRFGASHPEYFATDGKGSRCSGRYDGNESSRDGHLCWTSGVTNELYLDARAYLKGEPASARGLESWGRNCIGGKYVDIMPNDSFYDCQCETCRRERATDGQYAAERIWGATAAIAQRLIDEGVSGFITQMAYTPYGRVPDVQLPTNVLVMVARTGPFSKYDAKSRAQQKADIVAWTKKTGRKVWLWNYPGKVAELALKGVPQMCPRAWGEYYREMSPYIIGAFAESETDRWFFNHLNFYVFGKVCWHNGTDLDALLDDYYAKMYGPAAADVKELFEALEEMWLRNVTARCVDTPLGPQCRPPSVHDLWTKVYTRERIAEWSALLRRAVGKVVRDSLEWRRLKLVWNEILKPLSETSAAYLDGISVEKELARRAAETNVVSVVTNGDFTARPDGRFFGGWYVGKPPAPLDEKTFVTGSSSVRIEGREESVVVMQYLPGLKPSTRYRLSYFLKLDNLQCKQKGGGAGVSMMQGFQHSYPSRTSYTGTMDWTHCAFEFTSDPETGKRETPYIRLRLSAGTSGTAWFDGVRLVELTEASAEASAAVSPNEVESTRIVLTAENAEVVVDPAAPSGALFAATEMTNVLSRVFAQPVPLVRSATPGKTPIHVGDGPAARAAGVDVAKLPDDAFALKVDASGVVIAGQDDPKIDMFNRALWGGNSQRFPHATVFGVYEFLERFAGCRFYFPGRLGEIVPRRKSLSLAFGDYGSAPDFTVRYYSHMFDSIGVWPERDKMTDAEWRRATNLELYRLRMETHYIPFCHGQRLIGLSERFAKTHPEWFAMREDGSRGTGFDPKRPASSSQMCLTSGYWEEIYQDAKSYLSGEPPRVRKPAKVTVRRNGKLVEEYAWLWHAQHGRYFDVMPNDGIVKCVCPNCSAAFAKAKDPENYWATEIVWGKTVEMANRLKAEGVGGYLTQMAYTAYGSVPDFEIPTNVLVMLARTGAWSVPNRAKWEKENALVKAWSEKTHGNLCLWNYPGKYDCAGTTIPDVPNGTPHAMGAYLKSVAPWVVGTYQESCTDRFLFNYLTLYVFSRIAWNRRCDPEEIIAEHNRLMFGKAAKTMDEYIRIQENVWLTNVVGNVVDTKLGPKVMVPAEYDLWTRAYDERTVARLSRLLDRAEQEAGRDTIEAERIRLYRAETLAPLSARREKYLEAVLPEREFAYRREHPVPSERTLVPNGDFDKWISPWRGNVTTEGGVVEWDAKEGVDGPGCLRLFSDSMARGSGWRFAWRARATLFLDDGKTALKPSTRYRLSYFVKTDNVVTLHEGGGVAAAVVEADGSFRFFPKKKIRGTVPWIRQSFEFETRSAVGKERPDLRLAISKACGEAWFDGVRLDELGPATDAAK